MKIDELYGEFTKMCDEQEDCSLCKYGGDFSCQLSFGYSKGRADKYQEIVSEYMLLTEKQVAEIRADAIDEYRELLKNYFVIPHDLRVIDMYAQQLKEHNK